MTLLRNIHSVTQYLELNRPQQHLSVSCYVILMGSCWSKVILQSNFERFINRQSLVWKGENQSGSIWYHPRGKIMKCDDNHQEIYHFWRLGTCSDRSTKWIQCVMRAWCLLNWNLTVSWVVIQCQNFIQLKTHWQVSNCFSWLATQRPKKLLVWKIYFGYLELDVPKIIIRYV